MLSLLKYNRALNLIIAGLLMSVSGSALAQNFQTQWENLPGPFGGSIIQFDTDGNGLYALTRGGIYKSQNAGETWDLLEGSRNIVGTSSTFEAEDGVLYVLSRSGVLVRSRNEGKTWVTVLQKPFPVDLAAGAPIGFTVLGDTIVALTPITIYRSVNQGDTWEEAIVPAPFFAQKFRSFAHVGTDLFVAFDWFIFKSEDGGKTWKQNFSASYYFASITAVDSVLYALYEGYPRLIRSYDRGQSWDKIDADSIYFWQYYQETKDWLTGTGNKLFYASDYWCIHGGVQMFNAFNQGEDWSASPRQGLRNHTLNDLKALPQHLLAGTDQGLFRSQDDGASFQPYHQGMNATYVYSLAQSHTNRWWTNTRQGIFASDDSGQTWDLKFAGELESPCNGWVDRLFFTKNRIFRPANEQQYKLYMSEDGGDSWSEFISTPLYLAPQILAAGDMFWMVKDKMLYKMRDTEQAQTLVTLPEPGTPTILGGADRIIVISMGKNTFYSENAGETWEPIPMLAEDSEPVYDFLYIDNEAIFAYSNDYEDIVLFPFKEKAWKAFVPVLEGDTLKPGFYNILHTAGGLRWIAAKETLYYSAVEEPEVWYPFEPNFPFKAPSAIAFDPAKQEMWVGTAGAGIYKTKVRFKPVDPAPPSFGLYPNPSPGQSTLSSSIFLMENIRLRVLDVSGKLLLEQSLPPGQSWDVSLDLPNGMYVWQVITAQGSFCIKWIRHG